MYLGPVLACLELLENQNFEMEVLFNVDWNYWMHFEFAVSNYGLALQVKDERHL